MARRFLAYLGVLTIVGTGLFLASGAFETSVGAQPATSNKTTVAKTPWGDPDLQGIWSPGYYLTPLQRPNKYSGREFLTDEEVATLERQAAAAPGRNARLERGSVDDVEGAFNDAFTLWGD